MTIETSRTRWLLRSKLLCDKGVGSEVCGVCGTSENPPFGLDALQAAWNSPRKLSSLWWTFWTRRSVRCVLRIKGVLCRKDVWVEFTKTSKSELGYCAGPRFLLREAWFCSSRYLLQSEITCLWANTCRNHPHGVNSCVDIFGSSNYDRTWRWKHCGQERSFICWPRAKLGINVPAEKRLLSISLTWKSQQIWQIYSNKTVSWWCV